MKGKVVYVLNIDQVFDFQTLKNDIEVFESLEDAKEEFNKFVETERKNAEKDDWVIETDTELDFEAYEDGEYASNHSVASIEEKTIR